MDNEQNQQPVASISSAEVAKMGAPHYYASAIQIAWTGNDCSLILSRNHPGVVNSGPAAGQVVVAEEPQCVLSMSAHTLKDLSVLLNNTLEGYEAQWGVVETEFTRQRAKHK
ncbi:hypothetical protein CN162_12565 [Sinorhizobium meliloti]|uniref:hypothetical protein n=1 Tax=Rhizobium meliloti TaxID=382 RepID=UPI000FD3F557|nr:hypothetical protein [Sinorhizobium meliloti]RVG48073.1 hypothetical protein CN224_31335 [Sinorhizobium meliloti]RVK56897.1 hypothetical protein CN162_12565 [Sinorhizobium meliloti]